MSSLDLIKFALDENHVKFRSTLSEMLYVKLSEGIAEKTTEMISDIFELPVIEEEKKPDADGDGVPDWADKKPGEDDNADDEDDDEDNKKKKKKKLEEAKKNKKKDEEDEEEDEDEDDEDEDEDEDDEEEEEEDEEKETMKKGGKTFHFDINSHNKGKKK